MGFLRELLRPLAPLGVTFRHMFRERVTISYPDTKRLKPQRFHGRHVLNRYPDGMEKCIGCELCAGVCPARCIYVRGADNPPDNPVSPGERYGYVYEINFLRCIFCALCVEACPTEAITMTHLFEMSWTGREDAIFTREELLVEPDGTPRHPERGPLSDPDELREADGWMRATAPGGRAAYEGVVAWTPSAGVGLRPPEMGQRRERRPDADVRRPDGDGYGGVPDDELPEQPDPLRIESPFRSPPGPAAARREQRQPREAPPPETGEGPPTGDLDDDEGEA